MLNIYVGKKVVDIIFTDLDFNVKIVQRNFEIIFCFKRPNLIQLLKKIYLLVEFYTSHAYFIIFLLRGL